MEKTPELGFNKHVKPFDAKTFTAADHFTYIGDGRFGGKGRRLAVMKDKMESLYQHLDAPTSIDVYIPRLTVITTEYFERFITENDFHNLDLSTMEDNKIARKFLKADLPGTLETDLKALASKIRNPIVVRSSGLLEDSLNAPLAGIFRSKMLPNNHPELSVRTGQLIRAVKLVYASTFFSNARNYLKTTSHKTSDESMAVVIQDVVGLHHNARFYPNISGVARSYNFYPTGHAKAKDGIVSLALGLGKAIVDGGAVWTYSPEYPEVNPPYASVNEMLTHTQLDFWAVNLGRTDFRKSVEDTQYLVKLSLKEAEEDGTLAYIASTYDFGSDSINIGLGFGGSRIITFAPILHMDLMPVNEVIKSIMRLCECTFKKKVEIEFAVTFDREHKEPTRFALLQVRPMRVFTEKISIDESKLDPEQVVAYSKSVLGNGTIDNIRDIVYLKSDTINPHFAERLMEELEERNQYLIESGRPYLLIGQGRWGTSNPWMGIPVNWGQISGAQAIVEISLSGSMAELSQGSHFFHNISNLKVFYFCIRERESAIDKKWLGKLDIVKEGEYIRHVKTPKPLLLKVDGRKREGVILK